MRTIVVANPKGGSGKTTLATNVAGWLAGKRQKVALVDADPQGSASQWIDRRPPLFPGIVAAPAEASRRDLADLDVQWLVVDSPAGLNGEALRDMVRRADVVLVPVSPSAFDMAATARFLGAVSEYKAVRAGDLPLAIIGMRVDGRTLAAGELDDFARAQRFAHVTNLRDTQVYVHCARDGLSVFDLPPSRAEQDHEQWRPLTRWIARHAPARA
jgi:chromosome partitioning protein